MKKPPIVPDNYFCCLRHLGVRKFSRLSRPITPTSSPLLHMYTTVAKTIRTNKQACLYAFWACCTQAGCVHWAVRASLQHLAVEGEQRGRRGNRGRLKRRLGPLRPGSQTQEIFQPKAQDWWEKTPRIFFDDVILSIVSKTRLTREYFAVILVLDQSPGHLATGR